MLKNSFIWMPTYQEAFTKLKQAMSSPPILDLPIFEKLCIVECDASGSGSGVVLTQETRPITFLSQALGGKSLYQSTYEKELLALVLAIRKWRPYLLGRRFIVKTDHQSFFLNKRWVPRFNKSWSQNYLAMASQLNIEVEYLIQKQIPSLDDFVEHNVISITVSMWIEEFKHKHANNPYISKKN